ncbi:MAG: GNAT family N-acetyltransferase [Eubacteriales bacterium]|nr:GNAT family N-acetyltransferase [Eubacteriales bacterium]
MTKKPLEEPLLLKACQSGAFGKALPYEGGALCEAGFIYLLGEPAVPLLAEHMDGWRSRMFICTTTAWQHVLTRSYPELTPWQRWQMTPLAPRQMDGSKLRALASALPPGYRLAPFGAQEFARHPFGHGSTYATACAFARQGAGAAVYHGSEIVSSAASFITFSEETELDISTLPAHRRRHLGLACAAAMLLTCGEKGLTVHWDAQNFASKAMAEQLGFSLASPYTAYTFIRPSL